MHESLTGNAEGSDFTTPTVKYEMLGKLLSEFCWKDQVTERSGSSSFLPKVLAQKKKEVCMRQLRPGAPSACSLICRMKAHLSEIQNQPDVF